MSSPVSDIERLHHLAQSLFNVVRDEYNPLSTVELHLEECDAIAENPHCGDAVVRTLVSAQLLRYATRDPQEANPRYVVGLCVFVDGLVPALLKDRPHTSAETARRLHGIRGQIDNLCINLAVQASPGLQERFEA